MKIASKDVANTIEAFITARGNQWDWDDFISIRVKDPALEAIRQRCVSIREEFPSPDPRAYCSDAIEVMRQIVRDLRR